MSIKAAFLFRAGICLKERALFVSSAIVLLLVTDVTHLSLILTKNRITTTENYCKTVVHWFHMSETLFFYDLETSGINPREQRIMQFAGQRTDLSLSPVGEPFNIMVALSDDVLPDPDAILVTGITPQQSVSEGITEAEFLKIFHAEIATPGTIFVGYNTIRFDDEFIRYLHYRNFYDPYEWHWQDGKSRWDLLDVVRMTRALRPDGIKWPFASDGKPTNRLELLTRVNGLDHQNAHDALSDVNATIALANLIRSKQPKLFDYLLKMRDKSEVERLVKTGKSFIYSSGKYSNETEKTTVAVYLADNPKTGALVYDLRHDPKDWFDKTPEQLAEAWKWKKDNAAPRLPIKTLQYNRCPAIAPMIVLDDESKKRIKVNDQAIENNLESLNQNSSFTQSVLKALDIMNKQQQTAWLTDEKLVDAQLYDGFFAGQDKVKMSAVRAANGNELKDFKPDFKDARLNALLPLYRMRNFAKSVGDEDRQSWEAYRSNKLMGGGEKSRAAQFFKRLEELSGQKLNKNQQFLLEELQLYAESILPESN